MKIIALFMLLGAQLSLASNHMSPTECMQAVTQALSISSGQKLEAKAEKCELHVSYDRSQFGQMSIEFSVLQDQQMDPHGSPAFEMVPWLDARMDDQVNGLNAYDISRCIVSADQIQLKYTRKQIFDWHLKFKYSVQISLKDSKIMSATVQGDNSDTQSCVFSN